MYEPIYYEIFTQHVFTSSKNAKRKKLKINTANILHTLHFESRFRFKTKMECNTICITKDERYIRLNDYVRPITLVIGERIHACMFRLVYTKRKGKFIVWDSTLIPVESK